MMSRRPILIFRFDKGIILEIFIALSIVFVLLLIKQSIGVVYHIMID